MLPQFEISFFPSQIFWLIVCFSIVFCFVNFYFFPRMHKILLERENKIKKDIKFHEHNLHEIRELTKQHENLIKEAKIEADETIKSSSKKAKEFSEKRLSEIDANLNEKFEIAKKEIGVEIAKFEASIKKEILKSASEIASKIEEEKVSEEEIKKYVA